MEGTKRVRSGRRTLEQICRLYRTDKDILHSYIDRVYEGLFAPLRDSASIVLEIGVEDGGSLCMWKDYFRKATVWGVDNKPRPQVEGRRGVKFLLGDAYSHEMVDRVPGGIDILIDDGPHTLESMVFVVEHYSGKVAPGGLLVLEDIQDFNWTNIIRRHMPVGFSAETHDLRSVKGRYDDILMVLTRA